MSGLYALKIITTKRGTQVFLDDRAISGITDYELVKSNRREEIGISRLKITLLVKNVEIIEEADK